MVALIYSFAETKVPPQFMKYLPLVLLLATGLHANAQTAISSVNTTYLQATTGKTYTASGAPSSYNSGNSYTYIYGNQSGTTRNDMQINGFFTGSTAYAYTTVSGSYVKIRRANNPVVSGIRNLKFEEGIVSGSTITVNNSYNDNMESFFYGNKTFNSGTDNLFCNQGDPNGNNNDIERLDVIFPSGYTPADNSKAGFALFERGATNAHDPVKLALILSLNGSGAPATYSTILSITSANYGADVVAGKDYVISRRDNATDSVLLMSTTANQPIGGVFFKFSDFGIAANTPIYGYSVIPTDFTGTSADLIDYTNTAHYPNNTNYNVSGGIDLVSVTGMAILSTTLPITITSFDATTGNNEVALDWKTAEEKDLRLTAVETSTNSSDWHSIGSVTPNGSNSYSFTDTKPAAGISYYRLKFIDIDGSFNYSATRIVRMDGHTGNNNMIIAPNPATGNTHILLAAKAGSNATLTIYNAAGQLVQHSSIAGLQQVDLDLDACMPGLYFISVQDNDNIVYTGNLVKQ